MRFDRISVRIVCAALLPVFFLGLSGCSEKTEKTTDAAKNVANETQSTKEQLVTRRAQERWQALIAMDWKKAYDFSSPGSRELKSFAVFKNHMQTAPMVRKSAAVKSVSCEGEVCSVNIELTYIYMGSLEAMRGQETTSILKENWLLTNGNWWYVDSPSDKGIL